MYGAAHYCIVLYGSNFIQCWTLSQDTPLHTHFLVSIKDTALHTQGSLLHSVTHSGLTITYSVTHLGLTITYSVTHSGVTITYSVTDRLKRKSSPVIV